jgi:hypothetical protein
MRIPTYKQSVGAEVASVPTPRMPALSSAEGQYYESLSRLGEVGMKIAGQLAGRAEERNQLEATAKNAELEMNFRKEMQNLLLSEETENVKIDNEDVTLPRGLLNRKGKYAKGAVDSFQSSAFGLIDSYVSQAKTPEHQARLGNSLYSHYLSKREQILKYEIEESNKFIEGQFRMNIEQIKADAFGAIDSGTLGQTITAGVAWQKEFNKFKGADENKNVADVKKEIITNALHAAGTGAPGLLAGIKDKLNRREVKEYEKIAQDIRKEDQYEIETDLAISLTRGARQDDEFIASLISSGKISRVFGVAYMTAMNAPKEIEPGVYEKGFEQFIKKVLGVESTKDRRDAILDVLKGRGNKQISASELEILLKSADIQGTPAQKKLWAKIVDGLFDWAKKDFKLGGIRLGFSGERVVFNFLKNVFSGRKPEEAKKEAMLEEQIRVNPDRTRYEIGDVINVGIGKYEMSGFNEYGNPLFNEL